jgi:NDP-sugar pyrophosphorylase family protein
MMKAVILAGGLGTRLRPLTETIPKPLLPLGEQSLLEIQINLLKRHGFDEIFLATHYKADYIRSFMGDGSRYGVRLTVSKEKEPLGTAGPVTLLRDRLTEPFVLINGDILCAVDLGKMYRFALGLPADLCVGIKKIVTPFAFGRITYEGDYVVGVEEKPSVETEVLAGIYVMRPGIFELIPRDTYFNMDTLMLTMLKKNLPIAKYSIREVWLDIGQMPDYEAAQEAYDSHFKSGPAGPLDE